MWFSLFEGSVAPILVLWSAIYECRLSWATHTLTNAEMCYKLKTTWTLDDYMKARRRGLFFFQCYLAVLFCFYFLIVNSLLSLSVYFMHIPALIALSVCLALSLVILLCHVVGFSEQHWGLDSNVLECMHTFQMIGLISKNHVKEIFEICAQQNELNVKKVRIEHISDGVKKDNQSVTKLAEEMKREEERFQQRWTDLHERIIADLPDLKITMENLL